MTKRNILWIWGVMAFIISLIGCDTECGQTKASSPSAPGTVIPSYSFTITSFSSTDYLLIAQTDATDDILFTVTLNSRSVSAKSYQGRLEFNLSQCWTNAHKGGRDYPVSVKVEQGKINGVSEYSFAIGYWPVVECTLKCPEESIIYNGSTDTFQPPTYTVNYEANTYRQEISYAVTDKDGSTDITTQVGASNWNKLSDMLSYLSNPNNDGCSVRVTIAITPVRNNIDQIVLTLDRSVVYHCRKDVLVSYVEVDKYYDRYIAITYDATGEYAGGDIRYEWQVSTDPSADENGWITSNDNMQIHSLASNEIGKYLRCIITQTFEGDNEEDPLTSNVVQVQNVFSETVLQYNTIEQYGNNPSVDHIIGTATNIFGETVDGLTFQLAYNESLHYSCYIMVYVSKAGYDDYLESLFVTVQSKMLNEDMIPLATDVWNITKGKVKFAGNNSFTEYSMNNGLSWNDMTTDEFDASVGDTILIRMKASGTPNQQGYLMASEPKSFTVAEANIGTKVDMSGISMEIKNAQLKLTQSSNERFVTITANVTNYDDSASDIIQLVCDYVWRIDGVLADDLSYATKQDNVLTIQRSALAAGESYQVSLWVKRCIPPKNHL